MSTRLNMTAEVREGTGKGTARALRREKKIPAVIYGNNQAPVAITMNSKELTLEYNKGHLFTTLMDIEVDGKKELVLARDVQTHVVTDQVLHADFLRVSPKTKIAVEVPVHFINDDKSPAMGMGAILNVVRHTVEISCRATEIPEQIEVNLEGKEYGDSVNISDANMPDGAEPTIADRDFTIATLVEPKKADEPEDDTEAPEASDVPAENGGDDAVAEDGEKEE